MLGRPERGQGIGEETMKLISALVIAGLLLGGCVTLKMEEPKPGQYANYRDMMYSKMRAFHWKDVPLNLETTMVTCSVDILVNNMTPVERDRMDAYARGEIKISDAEGSAFERTLRSRVDKVGFDQAMTETCPATAAELAEFRAKNG
jgi:hypothetical protein